MLLKLQEEPISVVSSYHHETHVINIHKLKWRQREYAITRVGYHHKKKKGDTLIHMFHVSNNAMAFSLYLDTDSLLWYVTEVSDGLAS